MSHVSRVRPGAITRPRVAVSLLAMALTMAWVTTAGAGSSEQSSNVTMNEVFSIPVSDVANGVSLPSILLVTGARLDTLSPDGTGAVSPTGRIYLSLLMSSGPPQLSQGNVNDGHFFSGMTPLMGSAVVFSNSTGTRVAATRSDPVDQTYNPNATIDDGLVDAVYSFLVPIDTRSGSVSIEPTFTNGVEYTGFSGTPVARLKIGGPTTFSLTFPKKLTSTAAHALSSAQSLTPLATVHSNSDAVQWMIVMIMLIAVLALWVATRRRRDVAHDSSGHAETSRPGAHRHQERSS
ncbi:MAG: fimbrillin family protein [Acidimicrobiales bacterium]